MQVSWSSSVQPSRKSIVQDLIKERELEFQRNFTFKPKINEYSSAKSGNFNDPGRTLSLQQRLTKLSRPKSEENEKRKKLKRELDEEKY